MRSFSHAVWMIVLCLLPLLLLMFVLSSGAALSPWLFLLFLVACFVGMYLMMGSHATREDAPAETYVHWDEPPEEGKQLVEAQAVETPAEKLSVGENPQELLRKTEGVLDPVARYRQGRQYVIEGPLRMDPDAAYDALEERFAGSALTPLLQESGGGRSAVVLVPNEALPEPAQKQSRAWLNLLLVVATLATMTWAGAAHRGINILEQPEQLSVGLSYALALLFILGAHELGHYFTARRYDMDVSLPYFIPVPFALGTFGAFIKMKSLAPHRRATFDVAVAGPLAGLVIAIPALLVGLQYSSVVPEAGAPSMMMGGADVGSSVLFAFLAKAALGEAVLEGHRLVLHPVAFAGWLGLFVTALNLVPVGQLDGGHLVHALLGRQVARTVGIASLVALVALGLFVWSGLLFWAILIYFIAGTEDAPPLNAVSPLGRGRLVLGAATFALLLLIVVPVPHALYETFGIHCPYA